MIKAVNLIGMYVEDTQASTDFYQSLGFEPLTDTDDRDAAYVSLGNFRFQFIAKDTAKDKPEAFQKDAFGEPKGTGLYINIEVDAIDDYFQGLKDKGVKTSTEPRDWPWGHREFVLRDPDGYKLVFYQVIG